jgi:hypothetical protein
MKLSNEGQVVKTVHITEENPLESYINRYKELSNCSADEIKSKYSELYERILRFSELSQPKTKILRSQATDVLTLRSKGRNLSFGSNKEERLTLDVEVQTIRPRRRPNFVEIGMQIIDVHQRKLPLLKDTGVQIIDLFTKKLNELIDMEMQIIDQYPWKHQQLTETGIQIIALQAEVQKKTTDTEIQTGENTHKQLPLIQEAESQTIEKEYILKETEVQRVDSSSKQQHKLTKPEIQIIDLPPEERHLENELLGNEKVKSKVLPTKIFKDLKESPIERRLREELLNRYKQDIDSYNLRISKTLISSDDSSSVGISTISSEDTISTISSTSSSIEDEILQHVLLEDSLDISSDVLQTSSLLKESFILNDSSLLGNEMEWNSIQ